MMHPAEAFKPAPTDALITIGIDVSKDHLDAARHPSGDSLRVPNTHKGHTELLRWLGKSGSIARVVFEPTGPYHRMLEERLASVGLQIVKVNPRQARRFAEAAGKLAKTDRIDALMLARYGALLEPVTRPVRSDVQNRLAELVAARRGLMRDRTATLNRLKTLRSCERSLSLRMRSCAIIASGHRKPLDRNGYLSFSSEYQVSP